MVNAKIIEQVPLYHMLIPRSFLPTSLFFFIIHKFTKNKSLVPYSIQYSVPTNWKYFQPLKHVFQVHLKSNGLWQSQYPHKKPKNNLR